MTRGQAASLLIRIEEIQRRVAAGEIDLRQLGLHLDGKWDQDFMAAILELATAEAGRRKNREL